MVGIVRARHLTPELLWKLRRAGAAVPAPDGSYLVVPVTEYPGDDSITVLYRVDPGGGEPRPLTTADRSSSQPAISPDGATLAFVRKPEGGDHAQLALLPVGGGEARLVTDLPLGAADPRWMPDGSAVLFLGSVLTEAPDVDATRALLDERKERPASGVATEDRIYRYFDKWADDLHVPHVMRYDLATGAITDLMPGWARWGELPDPGGAWDVAPDGSLVMFSADAGEPRHGLLQYAICAVPTDGSGEVRTLGEVAGHKYRPRVSPDGGAVVYGWQRDVDFYGDPWLLVWHALDDGTETVLTDGWDRSASGWEFAADGTLWLTGEDDGRRHVYRMPPRPGTPERMATGGWLTAPKPAGDGFVYYLADSLRSPADTWRVPQAGGEPERVTGWNDELLAGVDLGEVAELEVTGADGVGIQAFLVYPPGHDRDRPAPLVQNIHGGPHGSYADTWFYRWNAQAFAAAGYVIAMVNFHGSSGRGYDFANSITGDWATKPAADVEAATDHLVAAGIADATRMAVIGGSYGGYLVAWLIGHTDRYAAAICHAGVVNLLGQYATDVTQGRAKAMGADAWEDIGTLLAASPSANLSDVLSTPTLVVHGEQDYRVPVGQGLELYGILKAKGVPARLLYYPDEGHWILQKANSLQWYGEVLGWLDRFLG